MTDLHQSTGLFVDRQVRRVSFKPRHDVITTRVAERSFAGLECQESRLGSIARTHNRIRLAIHESLKGRASRIDQRRGAAIA